MARPSAGDIRDNLKELIKAAKLKPDDPEYKGPSPLTAENGYTILLNGKVVPISKVVEATADKNFKGSYVIYDPSGHGVCNDGAAAEYVSYGLNSLEKYSAGVMEYSNFANESISKHNDLVYVRGGATSIHELTQQLRECSALDKGTPKEPEKIPDLLKQLREKVNEEVKYFVTFRDTDITNPESPKTAETLWNTHGKYLESEFVKLEQYLTVELQMRGKAMAYDRERENELKRDEEERERQKEEERERQQEAERQKELEKQKSIADSRAAIKAQVQEYVLDFALEADFDESSPYFRQIHPELLDKFGMNYWTENDVDEKEDAQPEFDEEDNWPFLEEEEEAEKREEETPSEKVAGNENKYDRKYYENQVKALVTPESITEEKGFNTMVVQDISGTGKLTATLDEILDYCTKHPGEEVEAISTDLTGKRLRRFYSLKEGENKLVMRRPEDTTIDGQLDEALDFLKSGIAQGFKDDPEVQKELEELRKKIEDAHDIYIEKDVWDAKKQVSVEVSYSRYTKVQAKKRFVEGCNAFSKKIEELRQSDKHKDKDFFSVYRSEMRRVLGMGVTMEKSDPYAMLLTKAEERRKIRAEKKMERDAEQERQNKLDEEQEKLEEQEREKRYREETKQKILELVKKGMTPPEAGKDLTVESLTPENGFFIIPVGPELPKPGESPLEKCIEQCVKKAGDKSVSYLVKGKGMKPFGFHLYQFGGTKKFELTTDDEVTKELTETAQNRINSILIYEPGITALPAKAKEAVAVAQVMEKDPSDHNKMAYSRKLGELIEETKKYLAGDPKPGYRENAQTFLQYVTLQKEAFDKTDDFEARMNTPEGQKEEQRIQEEERKERERIAEEKRKAKEEKERKEREEKEREEREKKERKEREAKEKKEREERERLRKEALEKKLASPEWKQAQAEHEQYTAQIKDLRKIYESHLKGDMKDPAAPFIPHVQIPDNYGLSGAEKDEVRNRLIYQMHQDVAPLANGDPEGMENAGPDQWITNVLKPRLEVQELALEARKRLHEQLYKWDFGQNSRAIKAGASEEETVFNAFLSKNELADLRDALHPELTEYNKEWSLETLQEQTAENKKKLEDCTARRNELVTKAFRNFNKYMQENGHLLRSDLSDKELAANLDKIELMIRGMEQMDAIFGPNGRATKEYGIQISEEVYQDYERLRQSYDPHFSQQLRQRLDSFSSVFYPVMGSEKLTGLTLPQMEKMREILLNREKSMQENLKKVAAERDPNKEADLSVEEYILKHVKARDGSYFVERVGASYHRWYVAEDLHDRIVAAQEAKTIETAKLESVLTERLPKGAAMPKTVEALAKSGIVLHGVAPGMTLSALAEEMAAGQRVVAFPQADGTLQFMGKGTPTRQEYYRSLAAHLPKDPNLDAVRTQLEILGAMGGMNKALQAGGADKDLLYFQQRSLRELQSQLTEYTSKQSRRTLSPAVTQLQKEVGAQLTMQAAAAKYATPTETPMDLNTYWDYIQQMQTHLSEYSSVFYGSKEYKALQTAVTAAETRLGELNGLEFEEQLAAIQESMQGITDAANSYKAYKGDTPGKNERELSRISAAEFALDLSQKMGKRAEETLAGLKKKASVLDAGTSELSDKPKDEYDYDYGHKDKNEYTYGYEKKEEPKPEELKLTLAEEANIATAMTGDSLFLSSDADKVNPFKNVSDNVGVDDKEKKAAEEAKAAKEGPKKPATRTEKQIRKIVEEAIENNLWHEILRYQNSQLWEACQIRLKEDNESWDDVFRRFPMSNANKMMDDASYEAKEFAKTPVFKKMVDEMMLKYKNGADAGVVDGIIANYDLREQENADYKVREAERKAEEEQYKKDKKEARDRGLSEKEAEREADNKKYARQDERNRERHEYERRAKEAGEANTKKLEGQWDAATREIKDLEEQIAKMNKAMEESAALREKTIREVKEKYMEKAKTELAASGKINNQFNKAMEQISQKFDQHLKEHPESLLVRGVRKDQDGKLQEYTETLAQHDAAQNQRGRELAQMEASLEDRRNTLKTIGKIAPDIKLSKVDIPKANKQWSELDDALKTGKYPEGKTRDQVIKERDALSEKIDSMSDERWKTKREREHYNTYYTEDYTVNSQRGYQFSLGKQFLDLHMEDNLKQMKEKGIPEDIKKPYLKAIMAAAKEKYMEAAKEKLAASGKNNNQFNEAMEQIAAKYDQQIANKPAEIEKDPAFVNMVCEMERQGMRKSLRWRDNDPKNSFERMANRRIYSAYMTERSVQKNKTVQTQAGAKNMSKEEYQKQNQAQIAEAQKKFQEMQKKPQAGPGMK